MKYTVTLDSKLNLKNVNKNNAPFLRYFQFLAKGVNLLE